ncbi:T3SS effector NleG family protein (plasmid) [Escherichia albertii]|uniref:T3SS effector NleG family protein n=1 Tax=Escherichia albertii TaxID=208962 RepID=UPI00195679CD|nr:T3SS effector NleG family protein [Escherichia albertii]EGM8836032.1 DUF1076 domain-containing protein [Escherichia albertii]EJZ9666765.1 T3SS effector NleG family protein [Escherichia albertii]EKB4282606.1 T3SS effector NleG family protein [Escherichia albertii]MCQ8918847.1 DUF1076 domain-containing protein [Escherichia albertii]MCQ8927935.1 DUF1076 domain-containing protein [Escherichia albertii]
MPITTLNISSLSQLSPTGIQALQDAARSQRVIQISTLSGRYSISHIHMLDAFTVDPVRGGLLDRLLRREHQMERRAANLERQLNGGVDFLGSFNRYVQSLRTDYRDRNDHSSILQNKINTCAFSVDSSEFSCGELFLTCPITLCVPESGIFMRASQNSSICNLYEQESLLHLVKENDVHPLSRESITASMIIGRDECYFDSIKENFILKGN